MPSGKTFDFSAVAIGLLVLALAGSGIWWFIDRSTPDLYRIHEESLGENVYVVTAQKIQDNSSGTAARQATIVVREEKCSLNDDGPRAELKKYLDAKKGKILSITPYENYGAWGTPMSLLVLKKDEQPAEQPEQ